MSEEKKDFISGPTPEQLRPTEEEQAELMKLLTWQEQSKHSNIRFGPREAKCESCTSLRAQVERLSESFKPCAICYHMYAPDSLHENACAHCIQHRLEECEKALKEADEIYGAIDRITESYDYPKGANIILAGVTLPLELCRKIQEILAARKALEGKG